MKFSKKVRTISIVLELKNPLDKEALCPQMGLLTLFTNWLEEVEL